MHVFCLTSWLLHNDNAGRLCASIGNSMLLHANLYGRDHRHTMLLVWMPMNLSPQSGRTCTFAHLWETCMLVVFNYLSRSCKMHCWFVQSIPACPRILWFRGFFCLLSDTHPPLHTGFVLMTLLINAPLISPLMGWLRLNRTTPMRERVGVFGK